MLLAMPSNLPHPPEKTSSGMGSSHRTENVTYQSSRVVKHTKTPQGAIRRMSLSVLVGQQTHFEGQGKARHSVTVPPSPETLKTIRDLVAGVTGFNMDRGDQLIVETLPFEPAVDADFVTQAPAPPKTPGPAWLEMVSKYRDAFLIGLAGLAVLMVCLRTGVKMFSGRGNKAQTAELDQTPAVAAGASPYALPNSADRVDISPNTRKDLLLDANDTTAERIRELAQRDVNATANVLRMWMQKQKA